MMIMRIEMTLADMLQQRITPLSKRKPPKMQRVSKGRAENAIRLMPHLKEPITAHDLADKLDIPYNTVYSYLVVLLEEGLVKESKGLRPVLWVIK